MLAGRREAACGLYEQAHELRPEDAATLVDLGDCAVYVARDRFERRNYPAAMRELDEAVNYYDRAINASPGFQAALLGKNIALELKGQFEEAVGVAEWAVEFVGPSARQQMFLAAEMEERGDLDAALLRLRQAVAIEPDNADAQEALGRLYHRLEKREEAVRHLTAAYRLDPARMDVVRLLRELRAPVPALPVPE